jgi:hypothetical protein
VPRRIRSAPSVCMKNDRHYNSDAGIGLISRPGSYHCLLGRLFAVWCQVVIWIKSVRIQNGTAVRWFNVGRSNNKRGQ